MTDTTSIPLADFIRDLGITATAIRTERNPHMGIEWAHDATHYRVIVRRGHTRIVVPFSQGSAHRQPPTAADVLDCLIADASSANQPFDDWCADYGYDTDSRTAYRTYRAVQTQTLKLRRLLGDAFDRIGRVEGL